MLSHSLIVQSQILILQETMTTLIDTLYILGHSPVCRVDDKESIPGSSTGVYSQTSVVCTRKLAHRISHKSGFIEILIIKYFESCNIQESVTIVCVYKSPPVSLDILMSNLDKILSKNTYYLIV